MVHVLTDMPDAPRGWDQSIETYLANNNIECEKATPLKGGNSAYIWRLDDYKSAQETHSRAVFKYGDTEIKGIPEIKCQSGRMATEVRALETGVVREACRQEPAVKVPKVLDTTEDGFVMDWAGETDLRTAFIKNKNLDGRALGSKLGKWLAQFHAAGSKDESIGSDSWRNPLIEQVREQEVAHLRDGFKKRGIDDSITERAVAFIQKPGAVQTLTIGDFRPMNTLLKSKESANPVATVVDWEGARYGDPAFDLRLWTAEALVLESKHGEDRGLLHSFLSAYKQYGLPSIVDDEFACRVAVVMGSICFWMMPLGIWDVTTEEEGQQWKLIAIDYIQAGAKRDIEWLKNSALGPLVIS